MLFNANSGYKVPASSYTHNVRKKEGSKWNSWSPGSLFLTLRKSCLPCHLPSLFLLAGSCSKPLGLTWRPCYPHSSSQYLLSFLSTRQLTNLLGCGSLPQVRRSLPNFQRPLPLCICCNEGKPDHLSGLCWECRTPFLTTAWKCQWTFCGHALRLIWSACAPLWIRQHHLKTPCSWHCKPSRLLYKPQKTDLGQIYF